MQRNTTQRRAIRRVLINADRPMAPREVLAAAQTHAPGLGLATVYRTLKALIDEEWLVPVEVPGAPQHYERSGKAHHHHFNCTECGRVFEMTGCPQGLERLVPPGFEMSDHEVFIYGHCAECVHA